MGGEQPKEILYWCGIREGELLALTPADFDFEKKTLRINKSYQRLNGQDLITSPKTEKSNRVIKMPQFLADEMQDYLKQLWSTVPAVTGCTFCSVPTAFNTTRSTTTL